MKILKYIPILLLLFTVNVKAQSKKNTEVTFKTNGVCEMCKERIETAALRTTGVKFAEWNQEDQTLKVVYNAKKVSNKEVMQAVSKAGHDTELVEADSSSYQMLPGCCKYKDGVNPH